MTLTEQWKKGELEYGKEYYVRFEDGEIDTAQWCYYSNQNKYGFDVDEVKEVLAPVPSYSDCLINEALIKDLSKKVNKLIKENNEFKELLKQWVHFYPIVLYEYEDTLKTRDIIELYKKTVNAIGEKK